MLHVRHSLMQSLLLPEITFDVHNIIIIIIIYHNITITYSTLNLRTSSMSPELKVPLQFKILRRKFQNIEKKTSKYWDKNIKILRRKLIKSLPFKSLICLISAFLHDCFNTSSFINASAWCVLYLVSFSVFGFWLWQKLQDWEFQGILVSSDFLSPFPSIFLFTLKNSELSFFSINILCKVDRFLI